MTDAEKLAELTAYCEKLTVASFDLKQRAEKAEAGHAALLRAARQAFRALELDEPELAMRTLRNALYDEPSQLRAAIAHSR